MNYAHERGYVHQDVKPDNVLFRANGNAVLTDFGIAEAMKTGEEAAGSGSVIGTPHYMSPEQAQGKLTDARSDLYSLGILFYEMLMGEVPYKGEEAVEVAVKHLTAPIPKLPPQLAFSADQLRGQHAKVRKNIEAFGRHPHRNPIYGRVSTPEEEAYIAAGDFPHVHGPPETS